MFDKEILNIEPLIEDLKKVNNIFQIISNILSQFSELNGRGREGFGELRWFYDQLIDHGELKDIIGLSLDEMNGTAKYNQNNIFQLINNCGKRIPSFYFLYHKSDVLDNHRSFTKTKFIENYIITKNGEIKVIEFLEKEVFPSFLNILPPFNKYSFFICSLNTSVPMLLSQYPWLKDLSEKDFNSYFQFKYFKIDTFSSLITRKYQYRYVLKDIFSEYSKNIYLEFGISENLKSITNNIFELLCSIFNFLSNKTSNIEIQNIQEIREKIVLFYENAIKEFCENENEEEFLNVVKMKDGWKIKEFLEKENKTHLIDFLLWLNLLKIVYTGLDFTLFGKYVFSNWI